jgi:hypothetical protein
MIRQRRSVAENADCHQSWQTSKFELELTMNPFDVAEKLNRNNRGDKSEATASEHPTTWNSCHIFNGAVPLLRPCDILCCAQLCCHCQLHNCADVTRFSRLAKALSAPRGRWLKD